MNAGPAMIRQPFGSLGGEVLRRDAKSAYGLRMTESPRRAQARRPLDHDPATLRTRRVEAGLTGAELAQRAEISAGHLSELESGSRNASPPVLARLARELGCEIRDLTAKRAA